MEKAIDNFIRVDILERVLLQPLQRAKSSGIELVELKMTAQIQGTPIHLY